MKVKELIEELQKQNQDAEVEVIGDGDSPDEVTGNPASCASPVIIHCV